MQKEPPCHQNIKETAYKAIIRPHLEYASPSWNPYTSRNINKIEAVQRRSARFVLGNYNYSPTSGLTHDIHHRLKWIPLQHRRALYDLALFYKIRSNMVNINFPPILVQPSFRQPDRYVHVQALHSEYKYNFFNSTPNQALLSANVTQFKTVTRNWITPLSWSKINSTWSPDTQLINKCTSRAD